MRMPCELLLFTLLLADPGRVPVALGASPTSVNSNDGGSDVVPAPGSAHAVDSVRVAALVGERARPGLLLRVSGTFGRFTGRASRVTAAGLSGLTPDTRFDARFPPPGEPVSWNRITQVEVRTGSSSRGMVIGGLLFGAAGGIFGGGISTSLGNSGGDVAAAAAVGALILGGVGTGVGAFMGSMFPRWARIYPAE